MLQLGLVRLAMSFAFGLLSNLRTVIWLALVITVLGFGYLVFTNGLDAVAAFEVITGYVIDAWHWLQGIQADIKDGLAGVV